MQTALQSLRLYLKHFPGLRSSHIRVFGNAAGPRERGWAALTGALGLPGAAVGAQVAPGGPGVPALFGVVERVFEGAYRRDLLLRSDEPAPGFFTVSIYGDRGTTSLQGYLFGDEAATVAAREEPVWQAWMEAHSSFIDTVLAGVAVADLDAALPWYERLLGRPADDIPMDGLAEWRFAGTGSIQLIREADRAGKALLTLAVDDLEKHVAALEQRGLTPGGIDDTTSEKVLFATITDPEGNTITLVENRARV